ncbi:MAG: histidinol dehydrogenase [Rhodospirillales bacterium]|nr:histidinol dehydrogenase [Rhodospirillales bacterium]
MPKRLDLGDKDFEANFAQVLSAKRESNVDVNQVVANILADVAQRGDAALVEYTNQFDRQTLTVADLAITAEEIDAAMAKVEPELLAALRLAAERIEVFHERQLPDYEDYVDDAGVRLGYRWTPVAAAGLYVPGGTAAYPSSVLMNAIPAHVAGVQRLVMVVPTPDGVINPLVLAAAKIAGVTEIYRIGGAQAVGALAYGTTTIKPVDKIVGPGNAYVAAAKRQVFGTVGIDMIAGPSEILVVADGQNNPDWIAADLLSQAEHDANAQSILITDDAAFADRVAQAVESQLKTLSRETIARASWENYGVIITVADVMQDAVALIDRIAPEHLELAIDDPDALGNEVSHAGAIFLGRYTPEAIGDYVAGPNHVLPTSRTARFSSGLGVLDFMKRTTFVSCDADSLNEIGAAAVKLADAEGLQAHGRSVSIRLNRV